MQHNEIEDIAFGVLGEPEIDVRLTWLELQALIAWSEAACIRRVEGGVDHRACTKIENARDAIITQRRNKRYGIR